MKPGTVTGNPGLLGALSLEGGEECTVAEEMGVVLSLL